ncbi:MAG: hypothetical protein JWP76_4038 [Dactylosporangium sp.]|jgi:hypothetical protein|nr:hypothetical protein [Dactylosporangium sp.]
MVLASVSYLTVAAVVLAGTVLGSGSGSGVR